jgi:hypothetical protein
MMSSTHTIHKLAAAIALALAVAVLTVSSALAAGACPCNRDLQASYRESRPAVSFSRAQGLKADGLRLQGIAQAYQSQHAASFSTPQGLKADGLRWLGIANTYKQNHLGEAVELTRVSRLAVPTDSLNRPAKQYTTAAKLVPAVPGNRFDWGDAGIGVAAAIGLMLLAAAGTIGLRKRGRLALHS